MTNDQGLVLAEVREASARISNSLRPAFINGRGVILALRNRERKLRRFSDWWIAWILE